MYADLDLVRLFFFYVQLIAVSAVIWFGANQIVAESLSRISNPSRRLLRFAIVFPAGLATLPLATCALAQFLARPSSLATKSHIEDIPGSPWENYGLELSRTVGDRLFYGSMFTAGIALGFFLLSLALTKRMRRYSATINQAYFSDYKFLALTLFLILGLTVLFNAFPVEIPQFFGVFGILAWFTFCIVAFTVHLTLLTINFRIPFIPIILFLAIFWSYLDRNDNHSIRILDDTTSFPKLVSTSAENFREWYESRPDLSVFKDEYPVYIVAAEGGGIYAAYQSATFLARLQDLCPSFAQHLFAISSVSGGSLGSALFDAALRTGSSQNTNVQTDTSCPKISNFLRPDFPISATLGDIGKMEQRVQKVLSHDFLSPLVAATLFSDFMQAFLPIPIPSFDRARSLELAFESAARIFER